MTQWWWQPFNPHMCNPVRICWSKLCQQVVLASGQARLGDLGACAGEFLALWVLVLNWKSCCMSACSCVCIYMALLVWFFVPVIDYFFNFHLCMSYLVSDFCLVCFCCLCLLVLWWSDHGSASSFARGSAPMAVNGSTLARNCKSRVAWGQQTSAGAAWGVRRCMRTVHLRIFSKF